MSNKSIAVQTRNLTKEFKQGKNIISALKGIDLTIEQGEFVAVMGASGSGKSTLIHLIAGLIRPTAGRVEVEGNDLSQMSDSALTKFRRRRIGLVFQNFNLIPHLTMLENITLPVAADGKSSHLNEKMTKLLEYLEIQDQCGQFPDTLSGGQQQRAALARALVMEPAVILADEPTGNLDSISSQNICKILHRLCCQEKRTIAVVTHEPAVAIWSQRIIILRDGKILADMKTDQFKDAHDLAAKYQELVLDSRSNSLDENAEALK